MKKGDSVAGKVKLRYKGKGKERYVRVIRWKREWVTELTRSAWRFFCYLMKTSIFYACKLS